MLLGGGLAGTPAFADIVEPNDANVAAAISGGQQYLAQQFVDLNNGTGYWNDYDRTTGTAAAVAALIESGKVGDAAYRPMIDKGIKYLLAQAAVHTNGGIYVSGNESYVTGMSLVALGLYGQSALSDEAYKAIVNDSYKAVVQKAVDFLLAYQNIEGSVRGGDYGPNGEATSTNTTACGNSYKPYYGGWGYYPGDNNTQKCVSGADLSNTQFIAMGLWYASHYLGLPVDTVPWAKALLYFVRNLQDPVSGGFTVYASEGAYPQRTGTASALWCLALIGQPNAKRVDADSSTMLENALNYYATGTDNLTPAYTWNNSNAYAYFIYGMSKALTGTIGITTKVGTHDWPVDMKTEVLNSTMRLHTNADGMAPATDAWMGSSGLDPNTVGKTSWMLMSLAFASTTTQSTEKLLAHEPLLENKIGGLVTLRTSGGVTISSATRGNVNAAMLGKNVVLPVGAVSFTLNNVPIGGTATLAITPPAGTLDPADPNSFVNADGTTLKPGLSWFKISAGAWKGQSSVPISIDLVKGVINVTLKDGGPEDADGVADGKILDPGAPGFGVDPAAQTVSTGSGCAMGNGSEKTDPTLPALAMGALGYLLWRRRSQGA